MHIRADAVQFTMLFRVKDRRGKMTYLCPDCQQPLEVLVACGCRDYVCNQCQQLVSKGRVVHLEAELIEPLKGGAQAR